MPENKKSLVQRKGKDKMNFLEERIVKDGIVKEGNILKVDSFLNHQMDVTLFQQMGKEFQRRFAENPSTKFSPLRHLVSELPVLWRHALACR